LVSIAPATPFLPVFNETDPPPPNQHPRPHPLPVVSSSIPPPLLLHLTCRPSRTHSARHHVCKLPSPNPSPPILSSWWFYKTSRKRPILAW
ncbi:hypothetical protein CLOP_g22906, partial [Closterium sp. NIES-67]